MKRSTKMRIALVCLILGTMGVTTVAVEAGWWANRPVVQRRRQRIATRIQARRAMRREGIGGPIRRWVAPIATYRNQSQQGGQCSRAPARRAAPIQFRGNCRAGQCQITAADLKPGQALVLRNGVLMIRTRNLSNNQITYANCQRKSAPITGEPLEVPDFEVHRPVFAETPAPAEPTPAFTTGFTATNYFNTLASPVAT